MADALDPHGFLAHVHPDLVKVIRAAAQAPVSFEVVYGLRTAEAEKLAVATHHSETLHSRHLANADGVACAVDFCVTTGGRPNWSVSDQKTGGDFGRVAAQIKAAAAELNIPIEWGGDPVGAWAPGEVSHFRDWGHIQLPWAEYP